jgi:hypothetical protein
LCHFGSPLTTPRYTFVSVWRLFGTLSAFVAFYRSHRPDDVLDAHQECFISGWAAMPGAGAPLQPPGLGSHGLMRAYIEGAPPARSRPGIRMLTTEPLVTLEPLGSACRCRGVGRKAEGRASQPVSGHRHPLKRLCPELGGHAELLDMVLQLLLR